MDQQFKQGYRVHCVLSNLNRLDVDQLDDADQERVKTARALLEEVSFLIDQTAVTAQTPNRTPDRRLRPGHRWCS